jgi:uncharacterized protein YbaR (Trm112 family)
VFVELIETLRCPRPHEDAQLVATSSRTEARHIVEGVLGCPVCGAEFTITNGIARFGEPSEETRPEKPGAETAMRLAAFLELTDARGFALLCGRWGAHADAIHQLAETQLVLVNPPSSAPVDVAAGVVLLRDVVPFAAGSARALALDEPASRDFVRSAVRAVRAGGRVLGPATLELPEGVTELVRDERMWVGEKTAASDATPRLVSITKASR